VLVYKGINALSNFRKNNLLARLKKIDNSVTDVDAEYIHFVDAARHSKNEDQTLKTILTYGEEFRGTREGNIFLVVPRLGTISPWSSKATDIIHRCGLKKVARAERGIAHYISSSKNLNNVSVSQLLHDRMTETVLSSLAEAEALFNKTPPGPLQEVDLIQEGKKALSIANEKWGLALSNDDIDYLYDAYKTLDRNPTDAELMMFGVVNSEHCRHKIFNADWVIDGRKQSKSLFKMIKNTYEKNNDGILSAYSDNAAVIKGAAASMFFADPKTHKYSYHKEPVHIVTKVETHNHPTAIAPFPGGATGSGGEIRDENATGRGAKPKIGLTGFSVSNLNIPENKQPWEKNHGKPDRLSSALDIMIEGPIGGASFNNEFGRPNLAGYFRTYEQKLDDEVWGYHKPIMIAGGLGNIREQYIKKKKVPVGAKLIVLGGPSMKIGLGGGSASSMQTGESDEELDFASVQRANAEIQRSANEVITACWAQDEDNPILSIHDIGAGGLSNGLPELVHDSNLGAVVDLRDIPNDEPGMSPMEIWCNEAQERYVLAVDEKDLARFREICERERCPFAVIGETTKEERLVLQDKHFNNNVIDLPMDILFGKPPKMIRNVARQKNKLPKLKISEVSIEDAVQRVLQLPAVSSKKFLITIGDRTVGGLCIRDQMVGPWQVPVSDVAVSAAAFDSTGGEAMAMGERTPLAIINSPASARMAIGEAITNMAAASIDKLSDIKLSANWMAAAGYAGEDEKLYDTVHAVGEDFCPALGMTIPVGKDSLSMRTIWQENNEERAVTSPLSLIISAFAPVTEVEKTLTPQLHREVDSTLLLIDLGEGKNRMAGSALAQVYNQVGDETPDANPKLLKRFFNAVQDLNQGQKILAYHDRSDGGLLATLSEMAFSARCGLDIDLKNIPGNSPEKLFNEELGAVIQVDTSEVEKITKTLEQAIGKNIYQIGSVRLDQNIVIKNGTSIIYKNTRTQLEMWWAKTSYLIQSLRDNPKSALEEFELVKQNDDPGLSPEITFKTRLKAYKESPKVAILREQGVNGQVEMAAAFDIAGFTSVDVHLNDLINSKVNLSDFVGLAACGGFSYGDVLGAGEGWAKSILFNKDLRESFKIFFERPDTFSLGVCNGCQMLANLKELIPGAGSWPRFLKNSSEQFEARLVGVKIVESPSIFFKDMAGSIIPIPTAHGEGRAQFESKKIMQNSLKQNLVSMQYVDSFGAVTERYPLNPNGSEKGITALTTPDGRATILMPHPERAFLTKQLSWHPLDWGEYSPWFKMFQNAREWVENN
jgi:phosphoribosylformylglycinamidine synthase